MAKHTLVVDFDGDGPAYAAGDTVLGGRLVAVNFGGDQLAVIDELLEALEHAVAWNEDAAPEPAWVIDAKSAIAKATGLQGGAA